MIEFDSEVDFKLIDQERYREWIGAVVVSEGYRVGELHYIYCDDAYLLNINKEFLQHDEYTDIVSFDYSSGKEVFGDIFISIPRVKENSYKYSKSFEDELHRVMVHGVLHLMGYKDKSERERLEMRRKEEEKMRMFHVEQ